jgi:hypothetical protein
MDNTRFIEQPSGKAVSCALKSALNGMALSHLATIHPRALVWDWEII